jgi:hypothetical protein
MLKNILASCIKLNLVSTNTIPGAKNLPGSNKLIAIWSHEMDLFSNLHEQDLDPKSKYNNRKIDLQYLSGDTFPPLYLYFLKHS